MIMKKLEISKMENCNSRFIILVMAILLPIGSMMAQDKIVGKLIKEDTLFTQPSSKSQGIGILPVDGNVTVLSQNKYGWTNVIFVAYENGKDKEYKGWIHTRSIKTRVIEDMKKYPQIETPSTGEHTTIGCENISSVFDNDYNFKFIINAQESNDDVVVKLCRVSDGVCIRMVYVRHGSSFTMRGIPKGDYFLKVGSGLDLRKRIDKEGNCLIVFAEGGKYRRTTTTFDFYREYYGDGSYSDPTWEYKIYITRNKDVPNVDSKEISLDEFNE